MTATPPPSTTRRTFLGTAAGTAGLALARGFPLGETVLIAAEPTAQARPPELKWLTEHLAIYPGPINTGVLRDGQKLLLVDCGNASVADSLRAITGTSVERLLFTHHHRDQACGGECFAK